MWSLPLEVTITNMIVSNKKVNKTKIKLKSLVTGFFFLFLFFLFLFLQSGERKKKSIHNESEWKKKTRSHVVKIHFPILTLHTVTFKHSFIHSSLDG